jgi:hypothetical protein
MGSWESRLVPCGAPCPHGGWSAALGCCGPPAPGAPARAAGPPGPESTPGARPQPGARLQSSLPRGVAATAPRGPDGRVAARWGQRAAHGRTNEAPRAGPAGQRRLHGLRGALPQYRGAVAGARAPALAHFPPVTRRDRPGLLHCADGPVLPRPNNDLEPCCGAHRAHERRAPGRTVASPAVVRSGAPRRGAAAASRLRGGTAGERAPKHLDAWPRLRQARATRPPRRTLRRCVRRDPAASLAQLEADFLKRSLPP